MRRAVSVGLAVALAAASFPGEASAAFARLPAVLAPGAASAVPALPPTAVFAAPGASALAPALTVPGAPIAPSVSPAPLAAAAAAPVPAAAAPGLAAAPVPAAPPRAAFASAAAPAASSPRASGEASAARAAALFDGFSAASDGARDDAAPVPPSAEEAAPSPARLERRRTTLSRRLFGIRPATRGPLFRAAAVAARVTGISALWGLYRDGVLVQRYAERLSDPAQAPGRRASSARLLAIFGRLEAVPVLGLAAERDASPRVRRAARAALLYLAGSASPRLKRTLKANPFPVSREAAAVGLGWLARHSEAGDAIEALGTAGLMDRSEGVRRAAIEALAGASALKAVPTLNWMLGVERRPVMRAALERALVEARARQAEAGRTNFVAPPEDLPLAASPLHAAALKSSIAVGLTFAAIEFAGGLFTGTLALRADALHLAGDRALDAAALFAMWIARRPPTSRKTYGWLKAEAVFSLIGSLGIAAMGAAMVPGAVSAFLHPVPAGGWSVLGFAALSVISNLASAAMLRRHQDGHLGVRGAFLHALTDAVGTFGVMIAAAASLLWGVTWLMPLATAAMVVMVLRVAWELGRPAWDVLLDAVPAGVDMDRLESDLRAVPGVAGVYDLHVRALNSRGAELAAKLYAAPGADYPVILASANAFLRERYGIVHATIQIEPLPGSR
jgi:cobalt-zinc-cadmium efflux system protein